MNLKTGRFYFLKDEFYDKFSSCNLMGNKDIDVDGEHGRPCLYCYEYKDILWMIPISSKTDKYRKIFDKQSRKYNGRYDGIRFGYVNGQERAFLIQNICPTLSKYIENQYTTQRGTHEVTISVELEQELNAIVRKVCRLYYTKGIKIVFTSLEVILPALYTEASIK